MAGYSKLILTNQGQDLLAQAVVDNPLVITRFVFGDGHWNNEDEIKNATQLKSPKITRPPSGLEKHDNQIIIIGILSNETNNDPFFLREIGVYAKLQNQPDSDAILLGVSYGNDGIDYIPAHYEAYVEITFKFILQVTDSNVVTVSLDTVGDFLHAQDLQAHNQDPNAHEPIRQRIDEVRQTLDNHLSDPNAHNLQQKFNQHNQDHDAHPPLRQKIDKLDNQLQNHINDPNAHNIETRINDAVTQHNQDPNAHGIQDKIKKALTDHNENEHAHPALRSQILHDAFLRSAIMSFWFAQF